VRKVAFFAHLLAGASAYVLAARLARHGYTLLCIAALAMAGVAVALFRQLGPATLQRSDVLFLPVLAGYALLLAGVLLRPGALAPPEWLERPPRRWGLALVLILGPIAAATWVGESAVATLPWKNQQPTPAALLASIRCGDDLDRCAPPPSLIRFVRREIPPEAVFAVDYRQVHEPSLFLPQQVNVWSGASDGLIEPELIFPAYFRYLERALAASLEQPFFNDRETREERLAFLRDTGVTYVLVTPRVHPLMTAVLARDSDIFASRYDDGRWALYEVRR
jgi:hypothetical protein